MSNYKKLIIIGAAMSGLGVVGLVYDFFDMYNLVARCPADIAVQSCQAYSGWQIINSVSMTVLVVGVALIGIGLIRYGRRGR